MLYLFMNIWCVGLARTMYTVWCIYGNFGMETAEYSVIYIWFWQILMVCLQCCWRANPPNERTYSERRRMYCVYACTVFVQSWKTLINFFAYKL